MLGNFLIALVVLWPVLALVLILSKLKTFYAAALVEPRRRTLYLVALASASVSTIAYLGYAAWRVAGFYEVKFSLPVLFSLEQSVYLGRILSPTALFLLWIGRGPLRWLLAVAILWVMWHLWADGGIIHWA